MQLESGIMGSWFSSKPKSKKKPPSQVTSKDRAILDLKIARDKTHQFKKKVGEPVAFASVVSHSRRRTAGDPKRQVHHTSEGSVEEEG